MENNVIVAIAVLAVIALIAYMTLKEPTCPVQTEGSCHGGTKTILSYTSSGGQCLATMKEVACAGNSGIVKNSTSKSGSPAVPANKSGDPSIPDQNLGISGCFLSDWSQWSTCTQPCGGGKQTRSRTVLDPRGNICTDNLKEERVCNLDVCEANFVNPYDGVDVVSWNIYEKALPDSADVTEVNPPSDVEKNGWLFKATMPQCQTYCDKSVDCQVIQYVDSVSAFDGSSGCTFKKPNPGVTRVRMSPDKGKFPNYTTLCKGSVDCVNLGE